jgi:glycosyltransferase involved in cell wall biosynthesis
MQPSLAIVVPCYNEEEVLPTTVDALSGIIEQLIKDDKISSDSYILFVDDGSKDITWQLIDGYSKEKPFAQGLKLSRNVGHQNALLAGLSFVKTDISVSIDADLQDDINAIIKMVDAYHQGYDVVYGVRESRESDTGFKRFTANGFYKLMSIIGVEQVENHADFRLLSARALEAFLSYRESNAYLRGIVPLIGYPSTSVFYSRNPRFAGESKYPLRKMLSLAIQGITSFSVFPLRLIAVTGIAMFIFSIILSGVVLIDKLVGNAVEGWASTVLLQLFLGGLQLLALGVIGEYIGKIYIEVKKRPKFFIESTTMKNER